MAFSVAMAGKGGTGKTTLAGLLVKYLVRNQKTPVLAVDADSNANLNEVLGLEVTETLGQAREEMKQEEIREQEKVIEKVMLRVEEQKLMQRLVSESILPCLALDVSDNDVGVAAGRIAGWLEETGGLYAPVE